MIKAFFGSISSSFLVTSGLKDAFLINFRQRFVSSTENMDALLSHLQLIVDVYSIFIQNKYILKPKFKVGYFSKTAEIFSTSKTAWSAQTVENIRYS